MADEEEDDYDEFDEALQDALEDDVDVGPGLPQGRPDAQDRANDTSAGASIHTETNDQKGEGPNELPTSEQLADATTDLQHDGESALNRQSAIMATMTEEQLNQYEAYRRSSLNKKSMRRLLQAVTGQNASTASAANVVIVLCGVAKMFVGELVENARVIAAQQDYHGPLQPSHIHEAFQLVSRDGGTVQRQGKRRRL